MTKKKKKFQFCLLIYNLPETIQQTHYCITK